MNSSIDTREERTSIIVAARGCDFNFDRDIRDGNLPGPYHGLSMSDALLTCAILELANEGIFDADASLNEGEEYAVAQGRWAVRTDAQGFHTLLTFSSPQDARDAVNDFERVDAP